MATNNEKQFNIFDEILASDLLTSYQNYGEYAWNQINTDNPSVVWENLKFNPWVAQIIFEDMEEKDATLGSCLDTRKEGLLSKPRRVLPASDAAEDKKIAEFVEDTLENYFGGSQSEFWESDEGEISPFESFLWEALDAVSKGVTIGEIIYGNASDRVYIEEVKFKPVWWFSFAETEVAALNSQLFYQQTGQLRLRQGVSLADITGQTLAEQKFFVFSYRMRRNNRWGNPLMRRVFWQSWMKRSSAKQWLRYQEKGTGAVVARYNDGAPKEEIQKAMDAAKAIHDETAIAIPKKFLLEVHEMVRNLGSSHKEFVDDFCNAEIARAILGQTLTSRGSDGGGSRALGQVHDKVRAEKIETDAKALMGVINKRIVRPLVFLNFGPKAKCPAWTIEYDPGEDQNTLATRIGVLAKDVQLPLSKGYLYGAFQIPAPESADDTLIVQAASQSADDPLKSAQKAEFAEKKTLESDFSLNLKTVRFQKLRPSMTKFSE